MNSSHQINIIFDLLSTYKYFILFPLTVFEGPMVMIISGFLSSIGFLNPLITYAIICAGDLTGDILYYCAGRWWFKSALYKVLNFFNVTAKSARKLESVLKTNRGKVLFFGKLSHALGLPILMIAGAIEVPFSDFVWFNFLATLPKSFILWGVGFYFANTLTNFSKFVNYTVLALFLFTMLLIGAYYGITYLAGRFFKRI